ncbi:MAG: phosphoglycerate kinase [Candidatus Eremiobacteraeota bacterium]|nr:phosphoglycerate kinase [Candidatus Eremiobacteraeota bacterium]
MEKATVRDIDVKDRRVLVRVDYNVPLKGGVIKDDTRIRESLPTLKYLMDHGAKVVVASHLGRPEGQVVPEMSLKPVAARLSELLHREVKMLSDCIGPEVEREVMAMKAGDVVMLENLRFHREETKNDREFSKKLASLAEIYVDDAFGTAHRAHASTYGVAELLPVAVAGFLMEKELANLGRLVAQPDRPFVAVLGGAKVTDKVAVLKNLVGKVDALLIGGGMAFTFLKVQGHSIGKSLLDENEGNAREILELAKEKNVTLELPVDVVVAADKDSTGGTVVSVDAIPADMMGVDIGPGTVELFRKQLLAARTIFWNGPMGIFENKDFARGTLEVAKILAESKALTCIGGGDSVAAVKQLGFGDRMTHLSTGGGASLEFMEGKELPGVAILKEKAALTVKGARP